LKFYDTYEEESPTQEELSKLKKISEDLEQEKTLQIDKRNGKIFNKFLIIHTSGIQNLPNSHLIA